jgi:hypothetical protein
MTRLAPLVPTRIRCSCSGPCGAPGRFRGRQTENKGLIGFVSQSASSLIAGPGLRRQSARDRVPYSAAYMKIDIHSGRWRQDLALADALQALRCALVLVTSLSGLRTDCDLNGESRTLIEMPSEATGS